MTGCSLLREVRSSFGLGGLGSLFCVDEHGLGSRTRGGSGRAGAPMIQLPHRSKRDSWAFPQRKKVAGKKRFPRTKQLFT